KGMVLHHDRQAFVGRVQRRALGNRPTLEDAVHFEPEVVMKPRRLMLLDDEHQGTATGARLSLGLGRPLKTALPAIGLQSQGKSFLSVFHPWLTDLRSTRFAALVRSRRPRGSHVLTATFGCRRLFQ